MPKQPHPAEPAVNLGSDASFRLLVQSTHTYAIALLDPAGQVVTWNEGASPTHGWRPEEIIGQSFSRLYPPEAVQKGLPDSELKAAAGQGRFEGEDWRVRKDGARFWASVVLTALHDPQGNLLGFGSITRDLTQQQRVDNRFRDLLEGAPDAIVITDQQGQIVLVNSQAEKLLGYGRTEMLGQSVDMLVPARFRGTHPAQRGSYHANPRVRPMGAGLQLYAQHKDGHEIPVEIALSPMKTEEGMLVTSSIRDVTERRQAEATIRQQAQEILELSTPVMQVSQGVVLAPLIGSLDSQRTQQFMERLLESIVETNSSVALVDVTGVPTIDTQTAQHLIETVTAVRLVGAQVILTGVRPAIAQTLVHLGVDLAGITTRPSLSGGLQVALEMLNSPAAPPPRAG